MIHMHITYTAKPGKRDAFLDAVLKAGIRAKTRQEEGNIRYDYFLPIDREDQILLVECWKDDAAMKLHSEAPYITQDIRPIKEEFILDTHYEKIYEAPKA